MGSKEDNVLSWRIVVLVLVYFGMSSLGEQKHTK